MIQTYELTRCYGKTIAVQGVNLAVEDGEIFGFLGLNGAGKTTVMRMICGLLRPSSGYSRVGIVEVRQPQDAVRLIPLSAFISQEMRFYESANLAELIQFYAHLFQAPEERGLKFARQSGVPLNKPCKTFSPGQQRKAQLSIALLKNPPYLLLDEPSAGLDPQGVAEMRDILRDLNRQGTTIFFSSHVLAEVQNLCGVVGILHQGKMRYHEAIDNRFLVPLDEKPEQAAQLLSASGIQVQPAGQGLKIRALAGDLPAILSTLHDHGFRPGLAQPINLETIFQQVISADSFEETTERKTHD